MAISDLRETRSKLAPLITQQRNSIRQCVPETPKHSPASSPPYAKPLTSLGLQRGKAGTLRLLSSLAIVLENRPRPRSRSRPRPKKGAKGGLAANRGYDRKSSPKGKRHSLVNAHGAVRIALLRDHGTMRARQHENLTSVMAREILGLARLRSSDAHFARSFVFSRSRAKEAGLKLPSGRP